MENTEEKTVQQTPAAPNAQDDKLIGVLSYLGILWVVAYILYGSKKTEYNLFHVKQGLGLIIVWVALWVIGFVCAYIPVLGFIIGILMMFVYLFLFVVAIIGIINAINGQQKPLILIGGLTAGLLKNFK
jgi:uncharacterized membrane protein